MCQEKKLVMTVNILGKNLCPITAKLKAFIAYSTITSWHHSKIKSQCCMNSQKYKIIIIIILGTTFKYVTCIILYT